MKRILIAIAVIFLGAVGIYFISSGPDNANQTDTTTINNQIPKSAYKKITPQEARDIMKGEQPHILLDVRTQEEFNEIHIPDAVLIPDNEIEKRAETELSDKDIKILVYCRSGGRSAKSAQKLIDMGYKNIYDIGGIIDWPYEVINRKDEL